MLDDLKDHVHVMCAFTLVGVVLLLFNVKLTSGDEKQLTSSGLQDIKRDQFTSGSGAANAWGSVRDDTGFADMRPGNIRNEVLANALAGGERMGNLEGPVFWNPGSFASISAAQGSAASAAQAYDVMPWDTTGEDDYQAMLKAQSAENMSAPAYVERLTGPGVPLMGQHASPY